MIYTSFFAASQVLTLAPQLQRHCLVPWLKWRANYMSHAWGRVLHWSPPNSFNNTLIVRPPGRRQKPMHEINVNADHDRNIREELRNTISQSLSHISTTTTLECTSNLTMEWQALSSALLTASQSTLGNMEMRHQDWFDDIAVDIRSHILYKNDAHDALLRNPTSRTLH